MFKHLPGILVHGHQVASRPSKNYPYSTLEKQKPYFKSLGLDLYEFFNETLNISIAPLMFEISAPELTFPLVEWTDLHPPDTFSFSRCKVIFAGIEYSGWVYYTHPETKKNHFQNPSLAEVITRPIRGIQYGDTFEVVLDSKQITLRGTSRGFS